LRNELGIVGYLMNPELRRCLLAARASELAGDWSAAASCYADALPLLPGDHRLLANLGNAFWLADQPQSARDAYEQAIHLAPAEPLPQRGLGNVLRDLGAFEQADHAYARSLAFADDPLTAWNHSQLLLGLERYGDAYAAAERRLELEAMLPFRAAPYAADHASLRGEASAEPLHLWSEQGLGDTLQYVRWLSLIGQQANAVQLEVEHQLVRLFEQGLSWLPHPPRVQAKPADGSPAPPISAAHLPLMSLPHFLGGAPLTRDEPYLRSGSWPASADDRPYPRIGLVWAAGRKLDDPFTAREYRKRSLPLQALGALVEGLHLVGAQLVNLQIGPDRDAAAPLASRFAEAVPEDADFADTAAYVRQLDLVISVDTAMAHLAGALGHPAWILLPWSADPRWLRERSDSPWYPSLRLWRQPQSGDWLAVVDALLAALPAWWKEVRPAL
jgi:tetratricopeptide (TPR) repeat protein